jgi:DNA-directed RNA polymerase specialized sigma24 family protein
MSTVKDVVRANNALREARHRAEEKSDERAIAVARTVDNGPRGTLSEVARIMGIKPPAVHNLVKRGRELIREREQRRMDT